MSTKPRRVCVLYIRNLDADTKLKFRAACLTRNRSMTEVIERFMEAYAQGSSDDRKRKVTEVLR